MNKYIITQVEPETMTVYVSYHFMGPEGNGDENGDPYRLDHRIVVQNINDPVHITELVEADYEKFKIDINASLSKKLPPTNLDVLNLIGKDIIK